MLKSIAKLVRGRGHAVREITGQLRDLRPLSPDYQLDDDGAGTLEEMVRRVERAPELNHLVKGRNSLSEAGLAPVKEAGHTLRIPLEASHSGETEFLCFTRLTEERWTSYRDRARR